MYKLHDVCHYFIYNINIYNAEEKKNVNVYNYFLN